MTQLSCVLVGLTTYSCGASAPPGSAHDAGQRMLGVVPRTAREHCLLCLTSHFVSHKQSSALRHGIGVLHHFPFFTIMVEFSADDLI